MLTVAQVGISLFGCLAFLLVTRDSRRSQTLGVVFGLTSNPFWWMMVISTEQWITVPVHLAYTYGWLSKAYRLWGSRPATLKENKPMYCFACGEPCFVADNNVSHHGSPDEIDYEGDADHVAIPEFEGPELSGMQNDHARDAQ